MYKYYLFTVYHLLFTVRSPFTVHRKRLIENAWKTVNGKWETAAPKGGASV
jgi:hypothetical protein